jgi:flagellar protein FliT
VNPCDHPTSPYLLARATLEPACMNSALLSYYEAIEHASHEMLEAARTGNWDHVVKLEGACALLISQLKHAAAEQKLDPEEAKIKSRIMQRILLNDAELRHLAEPWLEDLDDMLAGRPKTLH